jgi:transcriptional regulator with PAS, ATPase and Fis domain
MAELQEPKTRQAAPPIADGLIAHSPMMRSVLELLARVAATDTTVLIVGESGVGKELLAQTVHRDSPRGRGPFVSINCAAIPDALLESELFGYRRGAFTGASTDKPGLLATAQGGTLFLDEVADLPPPLQPKLLRFLQDRSFYPLGAVRPAAADVRIVAATNAPLFARVANGQFREDLYYRLAIFPITVPPLRDRPEDIRPLAEHFLATIAARLRRPIPTLTADAAAWLQTQPWRGNVRELAGAIERAVVLDTDGVIYVEDLRPSIGVPSWSSGHGLSLPDDGVDLPSLTRSLIAAALERQRYNIAAAARMLGISRPVLRYRIKKYGLRVERLSH